MLILRSLGIVGVCFFYVTYFLMFVCDKIYFSCKFKGLKNIPRSGGFILASNHLSNIDPFMLGYLCATQKRPLSYIAKESLFKNKIIGYVIRKLGAVPIKRDSSDLGAIKEALHRLKLEGAIVIFPEGTRGSGTRVKKPQAGIGLIAYKSQVPVVPVYIKGTDKALPPGGRWFRRYPVSMNVGEPIIFKDEIPYQEMSNQIMDRIYQLQNG